jgi:hypothetical protein
MRLGFAPQRARHLRLSVRADHPHSFFSLHEIIPLSPLPPGASGRVPRLP